MTKAGSCEPAFYFSPKVQSAIIYTIKTIRNLTLRFRSFVPKYTHNQSNSIMLQYFVIASLPEVFSPRFISLIPEQRAMVHQMMDEGVIQNYSLSSDRSTLWITFCAKSEDEVREHFSRFPLARYMKIEVRELLFQHVAEFVLPEPSLN